MTSAILCRLCITPCREFKCLLDDDDQCNGVYEVAAKYFDTKFLQPGKEHTTSVICLSCWQHINEFYMFQQNVIHAQSTLNFFNPIVKVIKLEDQLQSDLDISPIRLLPDCSTTTSRKQKPPKKKSTSGGFEETMLEDDSLLTVRNDDSTDTDLASVKRHNMDALILQLIGDLKCTICSETFKYYELLKGHFTKKHPSKECLVTCCSRKYNQRFKLVRHIRRIHNAKETYPYSCEICGRPFIEACKLKIHHQNVHNLVVSYDFKCTICGDTFQQELGLQRHINRRHNKTPPVLQWLCSECNSLFVSFENLEMHTKEYHLNINLVNRIHEKSSPLLICMLCKRTYKAINYFLNHLQEVHFDTTISSDLKLELNAIEAYVEHNKYSFITDEIMPESEYDAFSYTNSTTIHEGNELYMAPVKIENIKNEIETISSDSE